MHVGALRQLRIENLRPSGRGKFRSLLRESAYHAGCVDTKAGLLDRSGLGDVLLVGTLHARRYVLVAVISFVNLLHAVERFVALAHPLIDKP